MTTDKNRKIQRVTLFINPTIIKRAKAQAIMEDLSLSSFVEKVLTRFLPKEIDNKKTRRKKIGLIVGSGILFLVFTISAFRISACGGINCLPSQSPSPAQTGYHLNFDQPYPPSSYSQNHFYPTNTPYPTHFLYPTSAPDSTPTPYPTSHIYPTNTPYPTSTPYPTLTPYPTSTPYPVTILVVNSTPTPAPTFTVTPTPTLTPCPTITPTPEKILTAAGTTTSCASLNIMVAPTITQARRINANTISVSWGPVQGFNTYVIRYGFQSNNLLYSARVTGTSSHISSLLSNRQVYVQVAATDDCGTIGPFSAIAIVGGTTVGAPSFPGTGFGRHNILADIALPAGIVGILSGSLVLIKKKKIILN